MNHEIFVMRSKGMTYREIAEKHKISQKEAKIAFRAYCTENDIFQQIYQMRISGRTIREISLEKEWDYTFTKKCLYKYCLENEIKTPRGRHYSVKIADGRAMYQLYMEGKSFSKIAEISGWCQPSVKQAIIRYCMEEDIEFQSLSRIRKKYQGPHPEESAMYGNKKDDGMTWKEIGNGRKISGSTARLHVLDFCMTSDLELPGQRPCTTEEELKDMYQMRLSGMKWKDIAKKMGKTTSSVIDNVNRYCSENKLPLAKRKYISGGNAEKKEGKEKAAEPVKTTGTLADWKIAELCDAGASVEDVALLFGYSKENVERALASISRKQNKHLNAQELYRMRMSGKTYGEIAILSGTNAVLVSRMIRDYSLSKGA